MPNRNIFLSILVFLCSVPPALAAPFCVQTQAVSPECAYYDAAQCRKRANELNGYCVTNPVEMVILPGGSGAYCIVLSSGQANCAYADYTTCQNDAGPANGVCIEKSSVAVPVDPYRFDINRKY